ncbi:putative transcription factor MYB/SANT family [Dioscorea sansibarensis]
MEEKSRDPPQPPTNPQPPLLPETLAEPGPRRRAGGQKRKAVATPAIVSQVPSKRLAKERNPYNLPPSVHSGPLTRARQSPNKLAAAAAGVQHRASVLGGGSSSAGNGAGKVGSLAGDLIEVEDDEMLQAEEPIVDAEFDAVRSRGADVHVVPTHAGWFSWKEIHPLEKQALPSFFNGKSESRTPEIYLEIRDAIMKKFHADPQVQVELKDFSELSVGDMDTKQEVLEFLDHWGLINFHPVLPSNPDLSMPAVEDEAKANPLLDKLYQFQKIASRSRVVPKKQNVSVPAALPKLIPELAIADDLVRPEGPSVEYHCNSCSGDCSRKRYHCQTQADFDLCSECFTSGKFGSGMAPADFILMESAEVPGSSGGSWTDQETLLLLEALELFGENWSEIAEHVATKTKTQCILHFLQMPIEDPFLEGDDEMDDNIQENVDQADKKSVNARDPEVKEADNPGDRDQPASPVIDTLKTKDTDKVEISSETSANIAIEVLKTAFQAIGYSPEQGESLSFAESGNPVMALAAFLAGLVGPDDTTSIRSSLKAISEDSPSLQLATRHCFLLEDPPGDKKDPPAPDSAVTDASTETPKQDDQISPPEENGKIKGCSDKNEESELPAEKEDSLKTLESQEFSQTEPAAKELKDLPLVVEATPAMVGGSDDASMPLEHKNPVQNGGASTLSGVLTPSDGKESRDSTGELAANSVEEVKVLESAKEEKSNSESSNVAHVQADQEGSDTLKDEGGLQSQECLQRSNHADAVPTSAGMEEKTTVEVAASGPADENAEKGDSLKSREFESKQNETDTVPTLGASEGKVTEEVAASVPPIDSGEKREEDDGMKAVPGSDELAERDNEHNIDKVKRAAITALSAAAVKARLLANEEENQIRQLAALVIEKQLHKLETKMAYFTDIENMIMRAREQMDRTRQKLHHERAQIIAARLGMPSQRVTPQSLAANKAAMNYINTATRPPNMPFQKPPLARRP